MLSNTFRRPSTRVPGLQLKQDAFLLKWRSPPHRAQHTLLAQPWQPHTADCPFPILLGVSTRHPTKLRDAADERTAPPLILLQLVYAQ